MIFDKKTGIKIGESKEEALWTKVVQARVNSIKELTDSLEIEQVFLEAAKKKLKNRR